MSLFSTSLIIMSIYISASSSVSSNERNAKVWMLAAALFFTVDMITWAMK